MAVALEGVDLVAILVCLVAIALLVLLLAALHPLFAVINAIVGWVPGVGGVTRSVEQAILDSLNSAIDGVTAATVRLWNGLEWMNRLVGEGLHDVAVLTREALHYLAHIGVHDTIKAFLRPVIETANYAKTQVDAVGAEVVDLTQYAEAHIHAAEHAIAVELPAKIRGEGDYVGQQLGLVIGEVEGALGKRIDDADHAIGAIGGELAGLIGKLLGHLSVEEVAALIASIAPLALLVETVARESGLDKEACRQKVKGICGTDPLKWAALLAGLETGFALPSLEEMVTFAGGLVGELETAIEQFVHVG